MSKSKKRNIAAIQKKDGKTYLPTQMKQQEKAPREPIYDKFKNGTVEEVKMLCKEYGEKLNDIEKRKDNLKQQIKLNQELLKVDKRAILIEMLVPLCLIAALATHYMKPRRQIDKVVSFGIVGAGVVYGMGGYILRKKESKLNNQLKSLKKQEESLR